MLLTLPCPRLEALFNEDERTTLVSFSFHDKREPGSSINDLNLPRKSSISSVGGQVLESSALGIIQYMFDMLP